MSDDFLRSIQNIKTPIEAETPQTPDPVGAEPTTAGGISDLESDIEVASDVNLFSESFQVESLKTPMTHLRENAIISPGFGDLVQTRRPAPGEVSWDSILQIKQEVLNNNPDWQSIFQRLQNLSVPDRIATLNEMMKEGDLNAFIQKLPPEAHQALADFLIPLVRTQGPNCDLQLPGVLMGIFKSMNDGKGTFADTVRTMLDKAPIASNFFEADELTQILGNDPSPEYRLNNLLTMKGLQTDNPSHNPVYLNFPYPTKQLDGMINSLFQDYVDGNVTIPPPGLTETLQKFPAWGDQKLIELTNNGSMDKFVTRLTQSGENIGKAINPYPDAANLPEVADAFQKLFQELLNQKSPTADDIVRDMVGSLQNPDADLKNLSPALLIEMKLILQNGDDANLNAPALDIVNQAYAAVVGP